MSSSASCLIFATVRQSKTGACGALRRRPVFLLLLLSAPFRIPIRSLSSRTFSSQVLLILLMGLIFLLVTLWRTPRLDLLFRISSVVLITSPELPLLKQDSLPLLILLAKPLSTMATMMMMQMMSS